MRDWLTEQEVKVSNIIPPPRWRDKLLCYADDPTLIKPMLDWLLGHGISTVVLTIDRTERQPVMVQADRDGNTSSVCIGERDGDFNIEGGSINDCLTQLVVAVEEERHP